MSEKFQVPLHDADIIILLDDWVDNLKSTASSYYDKAKNWVASNK